ncbi:MAG: hypothetical protein JNJ85_00755 [Candidatus Kapabacteria bacterium]|nr:hypothetical protein [Candidatus Kapabacteria bacterium]
MNLKQEENNKSDLNYSNDYIHLSIETNRMIKVILLPTQSVVWNRILLYGYLWLPTY